MKGIPKFTKVGGCGGCRMTTDTAMQQFLPRDAIHPRYYSHGPVSVCLCLSVTSRCSTKTAKRRITQTTSHDSPGTLFLTPKISAKFDWGHPLLYPKLRTALPQYSDRQTCYQLSSECDKLDCHRSTKLIILPSLDT